MIATLALLSVLQPSQDPACPCAFNLFAADPAFATMHPLKAPTGWTPLLGEMISFKDDDGRATKAFWVKPGEEGKPCIVMVHEWWGLNDHIKETAEGLAEETGYGVLAIDMYKGRLATTAEKAGEYMGSVSESYGKSVVAGAVEALKDGSVYKASSIGTVGFCFGGGWSQKAAVAGGADVDACVIYYGAPDISDDALARLQAPVLMIWPTRDRWINKQLVDDFSAAMKKAGKSLRVEPYDADHAFANPSNARHNKKMADDAWAKTLAFYKEHLS
ncbi:MAG: dienelactone hydrolase family protein [Armatimonadetes bacterium]|nr:dienelactone hydrolase family protein [Armatimonadota bacterium]